MNMGYNINSFENMLKFMPVEHQEAYKALINAETAYRESISKYNRDVAAYNQREAERERVAKENAQVYTRTVSKTEEVPAEPEVSRPVEGPQRAKISEVPQVEERKGLAKQILENIVNALPSTTAYAEGTEDNCSHANS